jgi:outer membrane protein OmpA-like peptidoglycan-associated protein
VQADAQKLADEKKLPEALTAQEAAQVVRGIWWKTMPENYAHFGLASASPNGDVQPLEEMVKNISAVLLKTKAIGRAAKASDLLDRSVCERLQAAKFDPGIATLVQQPRLSAADDNWDRLQEVGMLDVEPNLFNRARAELMTDSEPVLEEVAHKLRSFPRYYLAIRGHAQGATPEDRELAKARADEALKWLKEKGGVEAQRMKAFGLEQSADKGQVTFKLLEAPR